MSNRHTTFSSSQIYRLCASGKAKDSIGKPFYTYVEEKSYEIKLGKPINKEHGSKATNWGNLVERQAFSKLSLQYKLVSKERFFHPTIKRWSGMPDLKLEGVTGDIKCPWTLLAFCQSVDIIESGDIERFKKEKPEYYWQLISNAILTDSEECLFIAYCPYVEDLEAIRNLADNYEGDQNKVAFVNWADDTELPCLIKEGEYKDVNMFQFKAPKEDIEFLTERVRLANKELQIKLK